MLDTEIALLPSADVITPFKRSRGFPRGCSSVGTQGGSAAAFHLGDGRPPSCVYPLPRGKKLLGTPQHRLKPEPEEDVTDTPGQQEQQTSPQAESPQHSLQGLVFSKGCTWPSSSAPSPPPTPTSVFLALLSFPLPALRCGNFLSRLARSP